MVSRLGAPLELDQIQRIVLRGSSAPAAAFYFLNVSSAPAGPPVSPGDCAFDRNGGARPAARGLH